MAIVHANLRMSHLKSFLSPIVIRSSLPHDKQSHKLMFFKPFFKRLTLKLFNHGFPVKFFSSKKNKKLKQTHLKKHFHPHLN